MDDTQFNKFTILLKNEGINDKYEYIININVKIDDYQKDMKVILKQNENKNETYISQKNIKMNIPVSNINGISNFLFDVDIKINQNNVDKIIVYISLPILNNKKYIYNTEIDINNEEINTFPIAVNINTQICIFHIIQPTQFNNYPTFMMNYPFPGRQFEHQQYYGLPQFNAPLPLYPFIENKNVSNIEHEVVVNENLNNTIKNDEDLNKKTIKLNIRSTIDSNIKSNIESSIKPNIESNVKSNDISVKNIKNESNSYANALILNELRKNSDSLNKSSKITVIDNIPKENEDNIDKINSNIEYMQKMIEKHNKFVSLVVSGVEYYLDKKKNDENIKSLDIDDFLKTKLKNPINDSFYHTDFKAVSFWKKFNLNTPFQDIKDLIKSKYTDVDVTFNVFKGNPCYHDIDFQIKSKKTKNDFLNESNAMIDKIISIGIPKYLQQNEKKGNKFKSLSIIDIFTQEELNTYYCHFHNDITYNKLTEKFNESEYSNMGFKIVLGKNPRFCDNSDYYP
jgi:hypothetical protein